MSRMKTKQNISFRERVVKESRISQQFEERYGWLVEEYVKAQKALEPFKLKTKADQETKSDLKPFPPTTAGMIGWLSTRADCQLEVFGPDVPPMPLLPDIYKVTRLNDPLSDGLEYCQ